MLFVKAKNEVQKFVSKHKRLWEPERKQSFYHNQILDFERNFKTEEMWLYGEPLWPILRSEFVIQLNLAWLNGQKVRQFEPYRSQLGTKQHIKPKTRPAVKSKYNAVDVSELETDSDLDFLFLTNQNSSDHVHVGDVIHNRILDPIIIEARNAGYSALKMELIKSNNKSLSKLKHYNLQAQSLLPPLVSSSGHYYNAELGLKFYATVKSLIPSLSIKEGDFIKFIDWMWDITNMYEEVFRRIKPKVVFFHPYYYYSSASLAAKRVGITSVDVQHGMMAGENPVYYDNWQNVPESGYSALPDFFWVWGARDASMLNRSFGQSPHKPIVGGYPWMAQQRAMANASLPDELSDFIANSGKIFLASLQTSNQLPNELVEMICGAPDDVAFLIRRHPKMKTVNLSPFAGKANVFHGDMVDHTTPAQLAPHLTAHIAASSAITVEFGYLDVPNIIYSHEGYLNYSDLIKNGEMLYVKQPEDFWKLLQRDPQSYPVSNVIAKPDLGPVFANLLANRTRQRGAA